MFLQKQLLCFQVFLIPYLYERYIFRYSMYNLTLTTVGVYNNLKLTKIVVVFLLFILSLTAYSYSNITQRKVN